MELNQSIRESPKEDILQLDLQKWIRKILSYWWLFALGFGISLFAGYLYLRYATFEYEARAILLIKEAGQSGAFSEANLLLQNQGVSSQGKAMDNEIQILKSLTLMEKVMDKLKANISYVREGRIKDAELYSIAPFKMDSFILSENSLFGVTFFIEVDGNEQNFILKLDREEQGKLQEFGSPFQINGSLFVLSVNRPYSMIPGIYRIAVRTLESAASVFRSQLKVERIGDQFASSVLELKLRDPIPQRSADILNTLIEVYNEEEISDETKVLRNTIEFIDVRVVMLANELQTVEQGIETFKSKNSIITENAAASLNFSLTEMRSALQQISELEVKKTILSTLEETLTTDEEKIKLLPANLVSDNPGLSGLVNQFNALVLERDRMATRATKENPARVSVELQLTNLKQSILETIRNLRRDLQIPINRLEISMTDLKGKMSQAPSIERELLEQSRLQAIKQSLFLFLLQKREETAISEAVTTPGTRIIDRARPPKFPIYPQGRLVYLACGLLGFFLPLAMVAAIELLDTRIQSEDVIKQITDIPIIGRIPLVKDKEKIVVKHGDRSVINEMFRLLRTNLSYTAIDQKQQILLITSSISGEGKSFIALNLSIALALANKKVVLLGLDFRKPTLHRYLNLDPPKKGVTSYLVGQHQLPEIILPFPNQKNLFYIDSGPIPPNPTELLLSERMDLMLQDLKKDFDIILMDTPPVGLVSDALLLRKFTSIVLLVVRHRYTRKFMLRSLEEMRRDKELDKTAIILNGLRNGAGRYGYRGYGYGYGKGYYIKND